MNPVWENLLLDTVIVDDIYQFYECEDLLQSHESEVGHPVADPAQAEGGQEFFFRKLPAAHSAGE